MLGQFFFEAGIYLLAAIAATLVSWRNCTRDIGVVLITASISTSIIAYFHQFRHVHTFWMFQINELVFAIAVLVVAAVSLAFEGAAFLWLLMIFSILDMSFVGTIIIAGIHSAPIRMMFGAITNIFFFIECLLVAVPGVDAQLQPKLDRFYGIVEDDNDLHEDMSI